MRRTKRDWFDLGRARVRRFCEKNNTPLPAIKPITKEEWYVGACAYYRPQTIYICLEECAHPCTEKQTRNWNWPGNTVDREPYGVLCHELGHHCDWLTGENKWAYGSEYSQQVMERSGEKKLTNYCPNPAEWFAEMFRLFVTNAALLEAIRPKTFAILRERWKPVSRREWVEELSRYERAPVRIWRACQNKIK